MRALLFATLVLLATIAISLLNPWGDSLTTAAILTAAFTGAYFFLTWTLVRSQQQVIAQAARQVEMMQQQVEESRLARESAEHQAELALVESRQQSERSEQRASDTLRHSIRGHMDAVGPVVGIELSSASPKFWFRWRKGEAPADEAEAGLVYGKQVGNAWTRMEEHHLGHWLSPEAQRELLITVRMDFLVRNLGPVPVVLFLPSASPGELIAQAPQAGGHLHISSQESLTVQWSHSASIHGWANATQEGFGLVGHNVDIPKSRIQIWFQTTDTMRRVSDSFEWSGEVRFVEQDGSRARITAENRTALGIPAALLSRRDYFFEVADEPGSNGDSHLE